MTLKPQIVFCSPYFSGNSEPSSGGGRQCSFSLTIPLSTSRSENLGQVLVHRAGLDLFIDSLYPAHSLCYCEPTEHHKLCFSSELPGWGRVQGRIINVGKHLQDHQDQLLTKKALIDPDFQVLSDPQLATAMRNQGFQVRGGLVSTTWKESHCHVCN